MFFRIPIPDLGGFTEELNAFLRGQRILSVQREHDSDPAATPPAPSHPAWQTENARSVLVGVADATPKAPGVAAVCNRQAIFNLIMKTTFDCVEMKNRLQAGLREQEQGLGADEIRRQRRQWLANSEDSLARWWRSLAVSEIHEPPRARPAR